MHRSRAALCFMLLTATTLSACGDSSGPDDVLPAALAGTWIAEPGCLPNCGFTFESLLNPADTINATRFMGVTTEITMTRAGRFTLVFRPGGEGGSSGSARTEGGMLIVTDAGGVVDTIDYSVTASVLRIRFRRPFPSFDFTGDGERDLAWVRAVLLKR
jgi:hypothetical protein